tara:strand:+ start:1581 stop:1880 length:300 start_codon:yes stop_codon:yes gene_type:complete
MFLPSNRHLVIKPVQFGQSSSDSSEVLLPEGYAPVKEYEVAEVVSVSVDCEKFSDDSVGHYVVFPGNMMKSLSVGEESFSLVQENYIMGVYVSEGQGDV